MIKIDIGGLKINSTTKQEFLNTALGCIKEGQKISVFTPYSEFLYYGFSNPKILEIFNRADFSLADGIGIFWAKKYLEIPLTAKSYLGKILQAAWQMKYSLAAIIFNPKWIKSALPEKIVGADLVWDLARLAANNNLSIFLLGGFGNTPELAKQKLVSKYPNIQISTSNKNPSDPTALEDLNKSQADILFVAYGPIKQEAWIAENLPKLNVKLAIGVGGSFDYIAGAKSAPPKFVRYGGLEWLWRLITQPYRVSRIINATFGLMSGLWRYKVFESLPYRENAVAVILNNQNQVLICRRSPKDFYLYVNKKFASIKGLNYWQMPQGGLNPKEDAMHAATREAKEEVGVTSIKFVATSEKVNTYKWESALRSFIGNKKIQNKGQNQHIVYFKFFGKDSEIKMDGKEFVEYKWVNINQLDMAVHSERNSLAKIVQSDLKEMAEKAII